MSTWDRAIIVFRCPQLKSIYCGTVQLVVFRLPEYLYILQHCINGIFNVWLPPMYAKIIPLRCVLSANFILL